jgi:Zn-dependent M28 family amino/carboxypeptidase
MTSKLRWLSGIAATLVILSLAPPRAVALSAAAVSAARAASAPSAISATPPGIAAAQPADDAGAKAAAERWWAHVRFLADDRLEGRLTGSAGYRKAADYVAQHFKEYGLEPAGTDGYFQPVHFDVQRVRAADSRLELVSGGKVDRVALGEDALLSSRLPQPPMITASLAFVGYALHLPDAGYDDLAAIDCKGKVVVFLNGGPADIAGALKSHARAAQEFTKALQEAGAIGAITIPNPSAMDIPWGRMSLAASQPGMRVADADLQDTHGPFFVATFNPARAEMLFAGSGHHLAELLALADAGKPLPRFAMPVTLRAKVATTAEQVESPNVVGVLRGADPELRAQYVVLSAHLDHLGVGEPINGDRIYNGAMDNASGVASLLAIAQELATTGQKPRRSLIFLAVCGEEKGLLGSRYYAAHPTVPRGDLAADLNMDMFLPLFPLRFLTVEGLAESSLGDDAQAVGAAMGVEIIADRHPDRNIFIRSDQYNFIRKGVPAVAFSFGAAPGSAEEKTLSEWLAHRYHAPSDDVNQPVDLAAAAKFNQLLLAIALRVADEDARPAWKAASFFRRFAQPAN